MIYVDLLCSLPHLENPFVRKRPPITAVQFRKRLNMLDSESKDLIKQLSDIFYWGRISLDDDDEKLVHQAKRLVDQVDNIDIKAWLLWRMDLRTVMAALRRRKHNKPVPDAKELWGYGRYVSHIINHWNHPTFKLESRFPWLPKANELLEQGDSFGLERHLLSTEWHYYSREQASEQYSLSDVWLYAMKWDLVDRWCRYNADVAKQHFEQLVQTGLKEPMIELRAMS